MSDLLEPLRVTDLIKKIQQAFPGSYEQEGALHWNDELDNGFIAIQGPQHVEVCLFDLSEDDEERLSAVAVEMGCEIYDWGN